MKSQSWTVWFLPGEPLGTWYCWEAIAGGQPNSDVATFPYLEDEFYKLGARNDEVPYFSIGENGYWLADNTAGLLTPHRFQLDENRASGLTAHLLPVKISDGLGIDSMSNTVTGVQGSQSEYWIMAPILEPDLPNNVIQGTLTGLQLAPNITVDVSCTHATANNVTPLKIGNTGSISVVWAGADHETESCDEHPKFKITHMGEKALNPAIDIDLPIAVKVMKRRTVKVYLYPVHLPNHGNVPVPGEAELEDYLNEVYGRQINAKFDVIYKGETEYPYANKDEKDQMRTNCESDLVNMANKKNGDQLIYPKDDADIRLFVIDATNLYAAPLSESDPSSKLMAAGITQPNDTDLKDILFVAVTTSSPKVNGGASFPAEYIKNTIAHEIGHVMMGFGHPDEIHLFTDEDLEDENLKNTNPCGPAPLKGTGRADLDKRLMRAGGLDSFYVQNKLLVKGEWDAAEKWLKEVVDERVRKEGGDGN